MDDELAAMERVSTNIKSLDDILCGGIPKGYSVVIAGPAGSMKTSLAFNILHHAAKNGTNSVFFSLEQMSSTLIQQMETMGMSIRDVEDNIIIMDIGVLRRGEKILKDTDLTEIDWCESLISQIKGYKKLMNIEICVIDSLNVLMTLTPSDDDVRSKIFHFMRELRELGVTTFIISESANGEAMYVESDVVRYVCDGLITTSFEKSDRYRTRLLQVAKMRTTSHPTDLYPLLFDENQFNIITK
ncbi:MAG: AAA family ATPase [Thermoplasmata archaeon]|nr:AAA family ATPase [Thermoplasmata archaeon]MCK5397633.1 AAA family ATPase [Thermoplasmata archaeon]